MSAQELDIRRSWGVLRRHRLVVAVLVGLGLLGGLACAVLIPAMPTGKAVVVLPPPVVDDNGNSTQDIDTQVLIANSAPILASAGQSVHPPVALTQVRDRVQVVAVTQEVLEIRAKGTSVRQAKELANSVADTYVYYVTDDAAQLPKDLGRKAGARVLERATTTTGGNLAVHLAFYGLIGAVAAGVVGSLGVLVVARGDRRLRMRDDIADAVGIPVLASLASYRAKNVADWTRLFQHYKPTAVDAWSLRKTLHNLGLDARATRQVSLGVVSFTGDVRGLSLGPQLAVFAASIGIVTELVVDTRHESAAALIAAGAGVPLTRGALRHRTSDEVTSDDTDETGALDPEHPEDSDGGESRDPVALRVYTVVADRVTPRLVDAHEPTTTMVVVSAGQVTAEELARLAVAAADAGRDVEGIVVADPEPTDRTTGRGPQTRARANARPPTALADASGTRR